MGPDGSDAEELHRQNTAAVSVGLEAPADDDNANNGHQPQSPKPTEAAPFQQQGFLVTGFHGVGVDDDEEEEPCGICLEYRGKGRMVELCCCRNTMCAKDAQLVGACPFCREEPLIWDFKTC